jgi:hypothetical protein
MASSNSSNNEVNDMHILATYCKNPGERTEKEYKQFCLQKGIRDNKNYSEYVDGILLNKNKLIITNMLLAKLKELCIISLHKYIEFYIPKYTTAFANTNIDHGELCIGVDDDGLLTGVPIFEDFNLIKNRIIKRIRNNLIVSNEDNIHDIINNTVIDIIPLRVDNDIIDDTILSSIIDKYLQECTKYKTIHGKYTIKRKAWIYKLEYYRRPLRVIINDNVIRKELIKYIYNNMSIMQYYSSLKIICFLLRTGDIVFTDDYIVQTKYFKNHYMYWLTTYRDFRINEILKLKPVHHGYLEPTCPWINIIKQFYPLTYNLINSGWKYYLIKIKFPGLHKRKYNDQIYYKGSGGNIKTCHRSIDVQGEPCCI